MLNHVGVPVESIAQPAAWDAERPTLVCFSHLRWDFVFQRPQHLMSRFARENGLSLFFAAIYVLIAFYVARYDAEIAYQEYAQFLFFRQWAQVKAEANRRGIAILGDMPIYVVHDSADVWANPQLFKLDREKRRNQAAAAAGVTLYVPPKRAPRPPQASTEGGLERSGWPGVAPALLSSRSPPLRHHR